MTKPYLLDRGRYGFAVRFNGAFDSAMPDEATARKVAAVDDLIGALVALYVTQSVNGLSAPHCDLIRAALVQAGEIDP